MPSNEVVIDLPNGISVSELKRILNTLPDKDAEGKDFQVHLSEGTSCRHSLLPAEFVLETTTRKTADGTFGVELNIVCE